MSSISTGVHEQVVGFVLDGTEPPTAFASDAFAGWPGDVAPDARRTVYRTASPEALARLGGVLRDGGAFGRTSADVPAWLMLLVDDMAAVLFPAGLADRPALVRADHEAAVARCTPQFLEQIAHAGGVPHRAATVTTLMALLHREPGPQEPLSRMIENAAGDAYLAQHADVVPRVVKRLDAAGQLAAVACLARHPEPHSGLVVALANSGSVAVRQAARAVVAPSEEPLTAELHATLDRFRAAAAARDIPSGTVDQWLSTARPCVVLSPDGDGPVVGRLGGPVLLPPDAPDPEDHLILTLDLAAFPQGVSSLPLPSDGHLLLLATPELERVLDGGVVYVPAGVAVEERKVELDYEPYAYDSPEDLDAELRGQPELRLERAVSLDAHHPYVGLALGRPGGLERNDAWAGAINDTWPTFVPWQIGGTARDHEGWGDPVLGSAAELDWAVEPADWVLLAQWEGFPMATVYWTIPRQDLAALRFDRVLVQMYANP
ncbi:hypothetical protein [Promicromonospora panici]|uniref:hypothetical protein n=1 Tax=Promicromonospora panici TaxID=2219658 RepID=UPI001A933CBA|nr:hypothetical protein [Promicromonospora panici]